MLRGFAQEDILGKAPAALILFFHPILEDIAVFYGMADHPVRWAVSRMLFFTRRSKEDRVLDVKPLLGL